MSFNSEVTLLSKLPSVLFLLFISSSFKPLKEFEDNACSLSWEILGPLGLSLNLSNISFILPTPTVLKSVTICTSLAAEPTTLEAVPTPILPLTLSAELISLILSAIFVTSAAFWIARRLDFTKGAHTSFAFALKILRLFRLVLTELPSWENVFSKSLTDISIAVISFLYAVMSILPVLSLKVFSKATLYDLPS